MKSSTPILIACTIFVLFLGAHRQDASDEFVTKIEAAHGAERLRAQQAIQADLTVDFGGQRMIDGAMLFSTDAGRSRLTLKDGTVAVFDGKQAWVAPTSKAFPGARFHLLTWPYFAVVPFKLRDPGTKLAPGEPMDLSSKAHPTARLTFSPGTGDAPDDWYILYQHPGTGRLAAMAYIVTYGKKGSDAEEPHAIVYEDFDTFDGVTLSTTWDFFNWSPEQGPHGEPIGKATLRNVKFVIPPPDAFTRPEDATEDPLPKP
jgi:hypothetical protein